MCRDFRILYILYIMLILCLVGLGARNRSHSARICFIVSLVTWTSNVVIHLPYSPIVVIYYRFLNITRNKNFTFNTADDIIL